jgi:hypothetical protein
MFSPAGIWSFDGLKIVSRKPVIFKMLEILTLISFALSFSDEHQM